MKIFDDEKIIEAYKSGRSMNSIAREYDTYATTIKRVLVSHEVEIRKDDKRKGALCVKDGEKLIEWAKAQGRQVTKAELADVLGRKRLSPSYFIKYPELGRYIVTDEQNEFEEYYTQLYEWLQKNGILYKTNDMVVAIDCTHTFILHLAIVHICYKKYSHITIITKRKNNIKHFHKKIKPFNFGLLSFKRFCF